MPSAFPRLLFAFVLAINFLLWSQSRYAQVHPSFLHGENSLVKRISYELLNPVAPESDQCRPFAQPIADQCAHVIDHCFDPGTFLSINYLQRYFCAGVSLRPVALLALVLWVFFLFSMLGISASDFFTPNLATIAQLLGLDENVAGATFLAFGNGSPDVFSTFSAIRANSGSLAIGELLGAASFIVSCVVGSMCIIKPFRVSRGPFLRDVGFFTVAVSLLLIILMDNQIQAWEAWVLVALYVVYVVFVVLGSWWERRQEWKRHTEAMIRAEYQDDEPIHEPYRDNYEYFPSGSTPVTLSPPSPRQQHRRTISAPDYPRLQTDIPPQPHTRVPSPTPSSHVAQIPSFSLIGAFEFRQVVTSLQHQAASSSLSIFESPVTPFAGGHYRTSRQHAPRMSVTSRDELPWDVAVGLQRLTSPTLPQSEEPGQLFTTALSDESDSQTYVPTSRRQRAMSILGHITYVVFPSLHHFKTQSLLGQTASIFAAPALMALTLTLPVAVTPYITRGTSREKVYGDSRLADFEEEGVERVLIAEEEVLDDMHEMAYNRWLMAAQCALAPLFCVGVLAKGMKHQEVLLIAAAIGGLAAAVLVATLTAKADHPSAKMARSSMGFFVAIVWIMAIADEVVNVLQTFGHIFGFSDAIIGLTIFAVGNSLADLVANMSVAVFAPIMGFSACFGGPMLNILLGVGLSGSFIIHQTSSPYDLDFSTTLFVSTIGLLILLAATLIFVPMNDYFLTRRWGILLIASYTTLMTINVVVELKSES